MNFADGLFCGRVCRTIGLKVVCRPKVKITMATEQRIFISSKMHELASERAAINELLPTLGQDIFKLSPWRFEGDAPASDKSIRQIYLEALQNSALYIGLFWNEFGEWTVDEFERATEWGIERHIYVKNVDPERRDLRLQAFLDKQSDVRFGITPRWFTTVDDLKEQVRRSLEKWLLDRQIAYHSALSAIYARTPDDIPDQPKKLIGRSDLIEDIQELLEDGERVLLHGFGGMGKSALAAVAAVDYIAAGNGEALWVKAGAADADPVFEALARALDAQQAIVGVTGDARVQALRHLLAQARPLIVLDDVWNGGALARVLKALPRGLPLLVTSRFRFPLDEILEVGELKPDEALNLLGLHVRRRDFSGDPEAQALCELLGNHAFALEIASKTLKVYDLTPGELLKRIHETPHDLTMPANFGEIGRTGIKSLLDTSVSALDKGLYDVFLNMGGLFEPSASPDLMARIMEQPVEQMTTALAELDARGLVNVRRLAALEFYRLHDLAYSYARTMYLNKGRGYDQIIDACRSYTTAHVGDLDALDVEQSNILEAAEAAHQIGRENWFVEIIRALTVDGVYFAARGHTAASLKLLHEAIDVARGHDQLETAHYLLSKLGNAYVDFVGDYDSALKAYEAALELARALGNSVREAILLTVIGKVLFEQKKPQADDYYRRAEALARALDDSFALSFVLHHRGYQLINKPEPEYAQGRALSGEAAQIAAAHELTEIYFYSLINRGSAEHELGLLAAALDTHQEAHGLAIQENNHYWIAASSRSIGEDQSKLGRRVEAQAAFDRALELWRGMQAKAEADDLIQYMRTENYDIKPEK